MTDPMNTLLEKASPRTEAGRRLARHIFSATEAHCEADILAIESEASNAYEPLVKALERLLNNAERIFEKKPVRDWTETLAEARAALATVESPEREGGE